MRRFVIMAIAVVLSISAIGQENENKGPDYTAIEKMIKDPNSIFYYPTLFKRYKENDTTLSLREYRMLYFGAFFSKEYVVTANNSVDDSLNAIFSKGEITKEDWQRTIGLCQAYLDKKPFELKKLNLVYFAYKNLGNTTSQRIYADKIKKIAYAILSSGDGLSTNSGLHVIQIADEYAIINMLGYEYTGDKELRGDRCDYLGLKDNSDQIKGIYFDLKQLFVAYQKVLDGSQAGK